MIGAINLVFDMMLLLTMCGILLSKKGQILACKIARNGPVRNCPWKKLLKLNGYSKNNGICKREFLCDIIFVMSFLWYSNSYIIIMTLCDSHTIMKSVTKFWISIKNTDRSHRCPVDTDKEYGPMRNSLKQFVPRCSSCG